MSLKKLLVTLTAFSAFGLAACGDDSSSGANSSGTREFVASPDDPVSCKFSYEEGVLDVKFTFANTQIYSILGHVDEPFCSFTIGWDVPDDGKNAEFVKSPYCESYMFENYVDMYRDECKAVNGKKRSDFDAYQETTKDVVTCEVLDSTETHYMQKGTEFEKVYILEYTLKGASLVVKKSNPSEEPAETVDTFNDEKEAKEMFEKKVYSANEICKKKKN